MQWKSSSSSSGKQVIFIIMFLAITVGRVFAIDDINTTVKLPDDQQIWPLPKLDLTEEIVVIEAEYLDEQEILSVVQGNWKIITSLIRYNVIKGDNKYPYDQIIFVVKDTWPVPESNIKVKKLGWPFRKGIKTFYMKKDENVYYKNYFNIITYSRE